MNDLHKEQKENTPSVENTMPEESAQPLARQADGGDQKTPQSKVRRWIIGILLAPIALLVLLMVLLYIPPIQRWIIGVVEEKVENATGMDLEIGTLRLKFPLNLTLRSIRVVSPEGDTLVRLGALDTSIPLMPLFNGQIESQYLAVKDVSVFFPDSARTTIIKADARNIEVGPLSVNLRKELVDVGAVLFEGGSFSLFSTDSVPNPDKKPVLWKIAANRIDLAEARLNVEIPFVNLYVDAAIDKGEVDQFSYDVGTLRLESDKVYLKASEASYAQDKIYPTVPFVDYTHLYAQDLEVKGRKLVQQSTLLRADVEQIRFRERSGASVQDFRGLFFMEDGVVELEDFALLTPHSRAKGSFRLPLSIFIQRDTTSVIQAHLEGSLGHQDILYFAMFDAAPYLGDHYPALNAPLEVALRAEGTVQRLNIENFSLSIPRVLETELEGYVGNFFTPNRLVADMALSIKARERVNMLLSMLGKDFASRFAIPHTTDFSGKVQVHNGQYSLKSSLKTTRDGGLSLDASYSLSRQAYNVSMHTSHFNLLSFLPKDSIGEVALSLKMRGNGFDFMNRKTNASVDLDLHKFVYKGLELRDITADLSLLSGVLAARLNSHNSGATAALTLDALLKGTFWSGNLDLHLDTLSMDRLGLMADTFALGGHLCGDFSTNLNTHHTLTLEANDLFLEMPDSRYSYDSLALRARTTPDTIMATLSAGDLFFDAYIGSGIDSLVSIASKMSHAIPALEVDSLLPSTIASMFDMLPPIGLDCSFEKDNPLQKVLALYKMSVERGTLMLTNSQDQGVDLEASFYNFRQDTLKIDQIYASMSTERGVSRTSLSEEVYNALSGFTWAQTQPVRPVQAKHEEGLLDKYLRVDVRVDKKKYRGQEPFEFYLRALSDFRTFDVDTYLTQKGQKSYSLGAILFKNAVGYGLTFKDEPIILSGYRLTPNRHNALFFNPTKMELLANLLLVSDQDAQLSLRSKEGAEGAEGAGKLNLNLQRLQLADIAHLIGMNTIEGYTFADLSLEIDPVYALPRVVGDISINDLTYEAARVGNISMAMFYEPRDNSRHFVDAYVSVDGNLALVAEGQYQSEGSDEPLNLKANVENFPLSLANPFLGADLASLQGVVRGNLTARGAFDDLKVNGTLTPENATFYLPMVGNTFAIITPPIRFSDSKLLFEDLRLSNAEAQQAFSVNGYLTLLGQDALTTDLRVQGEDVQLINSKYKRGQLLYGKLLTSMELAITGRVMKPRVRGEVDILSGTNLTYVYTESVGQATDNLSSTVTFTDFSDSLDSLEVRRQPISLGGMDLALRINVDPSVRLGVDLSPGHQDYVVVIGGGNLHFTYPPFGEMSLTGRYNLSGGGDVRYNFPVVGRKDFAIDPNSYLLWNGNVMNPYVDFLAKQRVRANVTEGEATRKVNFDVKIAAKETVDKIDLGFDLAAPEDLSLQGKLASMSKEERGKQALALMVTGTYLASDASPTNMQKVLSGLAVSELNSITGKLLQGTDLDLGMELHDASEAGTAYTDYTYNFSRRFYNDRLRISIGGKVGTGNLPTNYEQTFIDNLVLEYQLDKVGRQYIRGFHRRNSDNLLEGVVTETGIGYLLRTKLNNFMELFKREAKQLKEAQTIPTDAATKPTAPSKKSE